MITEKSTVREAKDYLLREMNKGAKCPCCNQMVKFYNRPLTSAMAYGLILLYKAPAEKKDPYGYVHIEDYFKDLNVPSSIRGDVPKLRFWGLIAPEGSEKESDKNPNNGLYKVTDLGRLFVEGNVSVPSHVKLYNNRFFGHPDGSKHITIIQALKNKFNYEKIIHESNPIH